jgi:hypothetical protein
MENFRKTDLYHNRQYENRTCRLIDVPSNKSNHSNDSIDKNNTKSTITINSSEDVSNSNYHDNQSYNFDNVHNNQHLNCCHSQHKIFVNNYDVTHNKNNFYVNNGNKNDDDQNDNNNDNCYCCGDVRYIHNNGALIYDCVGNEILGNTVTVSYNPDYKIPLNTLVTNDDNNIYLQ